MKKLFLLVVLLAPLVAAAQVSVGSPPVSGTPNQVAVTGGVVSLPTTLIPPGSISPGSLDSTPLYVTTSGPYTSIAQAAWSPKCFNTYITGCTIISDVPELFRAAPLPGQGQYTVIMHGSNSANSSTSTAGEWCTDAPIVIGTDRWYGDGFPNSSTINGTAFTGIKAANGDTDICSSTYFPARAPVLTASVTGTPSTSGGSLAAGTTYELEWVPLFDVNTAADSKATTSLASLPGSTAVYPGQAFKDNTTNCNGGTSPCTQVVVVAGTTGSAAGSSWGSTPTAISTQGTAQLENVGYFTAATSYGSPKLGIGGPTSSNITVGGAGSGSISFTAPSVNTTYPSYANSTAYTTGNMVTDGTYIYRAIGAGTSTGVTLNTTPGSQTVDVANTLYWQNLGPKTNYQTPVGFVPFGSFGGAALTSQAVAGTNSGLNGTCTSTVQVSNQIACAPGATFVWQYYVNTSGRPAPLIDDQNPLVATQLTKNNSTTLTVDSPNTVMHGFLLDGNNIASVALSNNAAQEGSEFSVIQGANTDEACLYESSPGAGNSSYWDWNCSGRVPNGVYTMQRLGCIFLAGNTNNNLKIGGKYTCTPEYSAPSGQTTAAGLNVNGKNVNFGTHMGLWQEGVADGIQVNGGAINLVGLGCSSSNVTNCLHIENNSYVDAVDAFHVYGGSTYSVKNDLNSTTGSGDGSYFMGGADSAGNRQIISTIPGMEWFNDAGILLYGSTSGSLQLSMSATGSILNLGANASISNTGVFSATTGFQVNGAAPSGDYLCGNGTNYVACLAGITPNPQTGTTYTYLSTDRGGYTTFSNASSIAVTLPQANSTGFSNNWYTFSCAIGAGTATITPTTSTISYTTGSAYTSGASSVALTTGQCIAIRSDNTNYFANVFGGSSAPALYWMGGCCANNNVIGSSATDYAPLSGYAPYSASTTEVTWEQPCPAGGATISNLTVSLSAAPGTGGSNVFTVRKNGSASSLTCTVSGASATVCQDTTHSFSCSGGATPDLLDMQMAGTSGGVSYNANWSVEY